MSKRTLGKARGLNSIADPSDFKGSSGRRPAVEAETPPTPPTPEPAPSVEEPVVEELSVLEPGTEQSPAEEPLSTPQTVTQPNASVVAQSTTTSGTTKTSSRGAIGARKRRELSVPIPVAEAVEATGVNPADLVMAAYKNHSDSLYAGDGGRMVSRGRQRLRVSISDSDFAKITRLGETRGWNRSETVSVLLTMDLVAEESASY